MCYKKILLPVFVWLFTYATLSYAEFPYDGRNLYTAKQMVYEVPQNQAFTLYINSNIPVTAKVEIKPKDASHGEWWIRKSFTTFQNQIQINTSTPGNKAGWYVQVTVLYDYNTNRNPQVSIQKADN